jgi:hypothetical protein
MDLGAFELAAPVGVAPLVSCRASLDLAPNPFSARSTRAGSAPDAPRRRPRGVRPRGAADRARAGERGGGVALVPEAGTRRGVYFLKAPGARPVAAYLR